ERLNAGMAERRTAIGGELVEAGFVGHRHHHERAIRQAVEEAADVAETAAIAIMRRVPGVVILRRLEQLARARVDGGDVEAAPAHPAARLLIEERALLVEARRAVLERYLLGGRAPRGGAVGAGLRLVGRVEGRRQRAIERPRLPVYRHDAIVFFVREAVRVAGAVGRPAAAGVL